MSRWWNEVIADLMDAVGPAGLLLIVIAVTALVAAAWYYYPAWLIHVGGGGRAGDRPARRKRMSMRQRWRWRRRRKRATADPAIAVDLAGLGLPDLPAGRFRELADQLAAQGRFAEAVRERLRSIVRTLVDAGVITNHPEWTVTELAAAASAAHPPLRPCLTAAARVFSDIWYGQRPATMADDDLMRGYAADAHQQVSMAEVGAPR